MVPVTRLICIKIENGGDDEDRAHDLYIANVAISQLSYVPTRSDSKE